MGYVLIQKRLVIVLLFRFQKPDMAEPLSLQHIARLICVQNLLDLTNGKDVTEYLKLAYHRYTKSLVVWQSLSIVYWVLRYRIGDGLIMINS